MSYLSKIDWTQSSWNPVTGCTQVSAGCGNCYAMRYAWRLRSMGRLKYRRGAEIVVCHHDSLIEPVRWKSSRRVFVCSMSDLFHQDVPDEFIRAVWEVMTVHAPQHVYRVLTKRSERLAAMAPSLAWPENIWAGVTVENSNYYERIEHLRSVPTKVPWISVEPLLGDVSNINLDGVRWVVCGGESGPGARPMDLAWAQGLRDRCREAGVAFWLKQLGGHPDSRGKDKAVLDGATHREWPQL